MNFYGIWDDLHPQKPRRPGGQEPDLRIRPKAVGTPSDGSGM